ncbi:hypothetical protein OHD16_06240 [Sphingobacterium sp. ML3W]|uniref:hypothetical protein n=1 Tax=Sphingobacterium sp. ML3W TaxID=1538644 RepID=UPI00249B4394|nr:hypothetical protein [Sphingobacterium sp. ML3W]WFA79567.1 hypothetical protein OGI71_26480 [Sphingobacterium sp. ML3W]
MQGRFRQYLFGVWCAILVSLGWHDAATAESPAAINRHAVEHFNRQVKGAQQDNDVIRKGKHRHHEKLRAYFAEKDGENDDTGSDPDAPNLFALSRNDFGNLSAHIHPDFYNRRTAVSLAHAENLTPQKNALYIHYSVFRL